MRSTYPDYFEKQKTTDTLPYSTREAHFANYSNKLKLQIGATHRRTRRGVGEGGRPPCLENFQGKLCFQGKRMLLKNPEW